MTIRVLGMTPDLSGRIALVTGASRGIGRAAAIALAKADDSFDVGGGDTVLPYLLLATSCDGTLSNVAQFTTVRTVCQNTLSAAVANWCEAARALSRASALSIQD